jgi:hypothetical protein
MYMYIARTRITMQITLQQYNLQATLYSNEPIKSTNSIHQKQANNLKKVIFNVNLKYLCIHNIVLGNTACGAMCALE